MPSLRIELYVEDMPPDADDAEVVGVDVIRATTTAITAAATGRRCIVVPSIEQAVIWKDELPNAYLVGELGGNMPFGFDLSNSPAEVEALGEPERPVILLSTSGTRLLADAAARPAAAAGDRTTFAASLRNWSSQARELLASRANHVLLLAAASRGEFREEDALCCAWIGGALLDGGFECDSSTRDVIEEWRSEPVERIAEGHSAEYLRDSGQERDLDFILDRVDDLGATFEVRGNDVLGRRT